MKKILLSGLFAAVLLSGCGGGGGSSSGGSAANTPTAASVVINESNKIQVAAVNVDALNAQSSGNASALSFLPLGVEVTSSQQTHAETAFTPMLILDIINSSGILSKLNKESNIPVGVTQTESCPGGGSATLDTNLDLNNTNINNVFRSGMYLTLTGSNCRISESGYSMFINGSVNIQVGSANTSSANITMTMNNATVSIDGLSVYGNGNVSGTIKGSIPYTIAESTQTWNGNFSTTINGVTRERKLNNFIEIIRNGSYSLTGSYSNQGYKTRYSANGLAEFSKGNVSVGAGTVKTLTTFETANGKTYPKSGQAIIKGQKGTLRITAQPDATNVFIELDANDDGAYESTQTMTWAQLLESI